MSVADKNESTGNDSFFTAATSIFSIHRVRTLADILIHCCGSCIFVAVFLWHFTDSAAVLPGAQGFGWFYKFVTFWGWTAQMLQYLLASFVYVLPAKAPSRNRLTRIVDDLSCLTFNVASTVTIMFWVLHVATGGMVERSGARPPWLGFAVHVLNFILAVLDIIFGSPRTFSRQSQVYTAHFIFSYATWLAICRYFNGRYPYPFMNKMPVLGAYFGTTALCAVAMYCIGLGGYCLAITSAWVLKKPRVEAKVDPKAQENGRLKSH